MQSCLTCELLEIRTGRPRRIEGPEPWTSSIFKSVAPTPLMLRSEGLEGDEPADRQVHGGPDKAVCVYSADHYQNWRQQAELASIGPGGFGENFTVRGCDEWTVCVGDVYRLGDTLVQVSQPRGPCWKLGRRWGRPDLPKLVLASGRTGWYLRVLREGLVPAGQTLSLAERPYPQWTIARVNDVTYGSSRDGSLELASCPALSRSWRLWLARR